jgi:hypothetical protein
VFLRWDWTRCQVHPGREIQKEGVQRLFHLEARASQPWRCLRGPEVCKTKLHVLAQTHCVSYDEVGRTNVSEGFQWLDVVRVALLQQTRERNATCRGRLLRVSSPFVCGARRSTTEYGSALLPKEGSNDEEEKIDARSTKYIYIEYQTRSEVRQFDPSSKLQITLHYIVK